MMMSETKQELFSIICIRHTINYSSCCLFFVTDVSRSGRSNIIGTHTKHRLPRN